MKRLFFRYLFFLLIIILIVACTTRKNVRIPNDNLILQKRLSDSIDIDLSDYLINTKKVKSVVIEPDVKNHYMVDPLKKTITIIPDIKLDELTKYVVTIKIAKQNYKFNLLTPPNSYITLSNVKSTPKAWLENKIMKFENDSIPLVKYKGKYVVNPTTICQFGLSCYEDYLLNSNKLSLVYFMKQVDYMAGNKTIIGDGIAFPYNFAVHEMKAPWYSALSQGHAVSLFIRAYFYTADTKYLELAKKSINYMTSKYPDGTLNYTSDSLTWLEEYPNTPPSSVLNGYVFALFGLIEYSKLFPEDTAVKNVTNTCLASLKKGIPFYDTGKWLIYDRAKKSNVNYHYMGMQTNQMKQLYQATKDTTFLNYYYKWEKYFNWEEWASGKKPIKEPVGKKIKSERKTPEVKKVEILKTETNKPLPDNPVPVKQIPNKPELNKPDPKKVEIM